MFESITAPDPVARLKAAAAAPLGAFLFAQLYFLIYPMLSRVPPLLFWSVAAILFAGTILGAVAIVRAVRQETIRGTAIGWLAGAVALELACGWLFLALTFPWL